VWLGERIGWTWPRCDAFCQPMTKTEGLTLRVAVEALENVKQACVTEETFQMVSAALARIRELVGADQR